MVGFQSFNQCKSFLSGFSLEKGVPKDKNIRKISESIDFNFIYGEGKGTQAENGQRVRSSSSHSQDGTLFDYFQCTIEVEVDDDDIREDGPAVVLRI